MANHIIPTEEEIEQIIADVKKDLSAKKFGGVVDVHKQLEKDGRKANILFSAGAWCKLKSLVDKYSTEVEWHGCVARTDENTFYVYDIIVPPHTVSSTTVTSDEKEYSEWITSLDDATFADLRFHGHSHVNMECTPSGVDMQYRRDLVTQLPMNPGENEDSFYIFMIFNKKGSWTCEIYDILHNALYESSEVSVDVDLGAENLSEFMVDAKKKAVEVKATSTYPTRTQKGRKDAGSSNGSVLDASDYARDWYYRDHGGDFYDGWGD